MGREPHAVREDADREIVDVVRDAELTTAQQRSRPSRASEALSGTGRGAERERRARARRVEHRLQVRRQGRIERDPRDLTLETHEPRRVEHHRNVARAVLLVGREQVHLDLRRRVADLDADHEPVELRLGQGKRAGEVVRVLRRDDEERVGQGNRLAVDADLALVHGLEQRRLGAGAGAVDLVGQEDVAEDRPLSQLEVGAALVVDRDAEDVAGQEVTGELDAPEIAADGAGQGASEGRLAHTGHVLDQQMTAAKQRHERKLDHIGFALERPFDGRSQSGEDRRRLVGHGHGRRHRLKR